MRKQCPTVCRVGCLCVGTRPPVDLRADGTMSDRAMALKDVLDRRSLWRKRRLRTRYHGCGACGVDGLVVPALPILGGR